MRGVEVSRFLGFQALLFACARTPSTVTTPSTYASDAEAPERADASPPGNLETSTPEAGAAEDAEAVDAGRAPPRSVLHIGDSMVGGFGGLTKALETHFKPLGSKFKSDSQTSVSIQIFARDKHFAELLAKHDPDLVIITLGANDILAPFPKSLGPFVQAIAKKTAGRECWWLPPIPWKAAAASGPGFIQVIKDNAAPCKVYDGSSLTVARGPDGIHPTDRGGTVWAKGFLEAYDAP